MSVKAPSSVPSPKPVPPTPTPTPVLPPPRPSPVPPKLQPPVDPPVLPPVSTPPPVPPPTSPPIPPPPKPSPPPPPDLSPTPPPDLPPPPPSNPSPPLPPDTPLLSPPQFLSPPPPYEPPPPQSAASPNTVSVGLIAGIAAGSVVFGAMVIVIFVLLFRRRKKDDEDAYDYPYIRPSPTPRGYPFVPGMEQKTIFDPQTPRDSLSSRNSKNAPGNRSGPDPTSSPKTPPPPSVPTAFGGGAYNYEELQLATNGLSELNVLGQGGFGVVYQGTLRGKEVAIKKLKTGGGQGDREFRTEVEVISRVHHRNLVSLEGYCIHEDQRLLVYEFVPNKTLDFHLHGSGRPTLDWLRRWKIALGSAKGLAYLHEDCHPKIIHRDIKAANILLDYHFEPKVADFGLAKLVPENVTHVSTQIMGTFGYLAPEYATSGQLTDRSDVYSYGVMLLELITGRKPVMGSDPNVDQSLVYWARPLLRRATKEEMCDELIDPWLENNYDQYDMARLIHCAAAAVRDSARMRPRMGQIVRYLEGEIALEDLNAGMMPGNSNVKVNSADEATLRRMAFGGVITEDYAESDRTSEYELTASSSAYTEEMDDHRVNKKSSGEA